MARPVQPIGTFGTIAVKKVRERTFYASTRFRAYNVATFGSAPPAEQLSAS